VCANHFRLLSITRFHLVNQRQICGGFFFFSLSLSYCPRLVNIQSDPYVKPWPCRGFLRRAHRTVSRLRKLLTNKILMVHLAEMLHVLQEPVWKQWECRARMVSLYKTIFSVVVREEGKSRHKYKKAIHIYPG